jgi:hypothetical protein
VGICIRPQDIAMIDGKPVHQAADDEHAARILREKIAYAKQRWGCVLFLCGFNRDCRSPVLSGGF